MATIGYLNTNTTKNGEYLKGRIETIELDLDIFLQENLQKSSEKMPDFNVLTTSHTGRAVKIGAGWRKLKTSTEGRSFEFLSMQIDDPSLSEALNVVAFEREAGGYDINWQRAKR